MLFSSLSFKLPLWHPPPLPPGDLRSWFLEMCLGKSPKQSPSLCSCGWAEGGGGGVSPRAGSRASRFCLIYPFASSSPSSHGHLCVSYAQSQDMLSLQSCILSSQTQKKTGRQQALCIHFLDSSLQHFVSPESPTDKTLWLPILM